MGRIFVIVFLLLASLGIGMLYLQPQWNEYASLTKEVEDLREISSQYDKLKASHDVLIRKIDSVPQTERSRLDTAIPSTPQAGEYLVLLETLSKANNVSLRNVNLTNIIAESSSKSKQPKPGSSLESKAGKEIGEFPIALSVSGSYESVKSFLRELERSLRITDVNGITFVAPQRNDQSIDLELKAKAYFQ